MDSSFPPVDPRPRDFGRFFCMYLYTPAHERESLLQRNRNHPTLCSLLASLPAALSPSPVFRSLKLLLCKQIHLHRTLSSPPPLRIRPHSFLALDYHLPLCVLAAMLAIFALLLVSLSDILIENSSPKMSIVSHCCTFSRGIGQHATCIIAWPPGEWDLTSVCSVQCRANDR